MRVCLVAVFLVSVCYRGLAQQPACTVPVTVVTPNLSPAQQATLDAMDWQPPLPSWKYMWLDFITPRLESLPVTNLSADAFLARDKKGPIRVLSATYDTGPRRIVFVAENAKKMPAAAREIEAAVISQVLSKARSEDSFALLTARGPRVELRFGSSREAVLTAAKQIANPPQGKPGKGGVLDAVLEATTWLQPHRPGDSIFVMTMGLERKHSANLPKVRIAVAAGGIRVFAVQLGRYEIRSVAGGVDGAVPYGGPDSDLTSAAFGLTAYFRQTVQLAGESGGSWLLENTEGRSYALSSGRRRWLLFEAEKMYKAAIKLYLVGLDSTSSGLSIRLTPSGLERTPWVRVSYPSYLPVCSNARSLGSGQEPPCTVPVNVTVPDLASLPKAAADTLAAEWKQNLQAQKYQLADGSWNQSEASHDFWKSLNRATQPKMALIDDLLVDDLVVRDKKRILQVQSLTSARGPHRIVFVAENGKMPSAARTIEAEVITHILSRARAEDSFALLTAEGPPVQLPFGSSRDGIRAAAEELRNPPQGKGGSPGALAAVLEATTWLRPPQPGDSIIVLSLGLQSGVTVTFSKVRAALAAGHIRLFGVQLDWFNYAATQLFNESGGWVTIGMRRRGPQSDLTDERLDQLKGNAEEMYTEATEHYLLHLHSIGEHLTIDLAPSALSRYPWAHVRYPHNLPACASAATAVPAEAEPRR